MTRPRTLNLNEAGGYNGPTSCDGTAARQTGGYTGSISGGGEGEECTFSETESGRSGGGGVDCSLCYDGMNNDCVDGTDFNDYKCNSCNPSPIIIDTLGNGFAFTTAASGVRFDIAAIGRALQVAWTVTGSDDVWLALDRNSNGRIDNGRELFGNVTPQPWSANPNGFIALAEYDKPANGGNNDGMIDNRDAIFSNLRLWQDTNHNGISEATELKTLPTLNVNGMELRYVDRSYRDQHGNNFRYHSVVYANRTDPRTWRWASDVFLVFAP